MAISQFKNYSIYYNNTKYLELFKDILENKYEIIKMYAQLDRGFVAKIALNGEYYIIKKIIIIDKLRKLRSLYRKGEAREVFENTTKAHEEGIKEFAEVYGAAVLKKNKMIKEQILLIEHIDTNKQHLEKNIDSLLIMEQFLKKLHKNKRCFGDVHCGNFLIDKNQNLRAIDSRVRKPFFGKFFFHKDMVNLKRGFEPEIKYMHPYKKDIYYKCLFFLYGVKNIKMHLRTNIKNLKNKLKII